MAKSKSTRAAVRKTNPRARPMVVEYRWFPVSKTAGLLGGICAETRKDADAFKDGSERLVRVRLEYQP